MPPIRGGSAHRRLNDLKKAESQEANRRDAEQDAAISVMLHRA
jgi:hypothetical protein